MTNETKIALQEYYGSLMQQKQDCHCWFAIRRIDNKMKAIETLLDIDLL